MEWQIIVALALAIPVILFPAAFIWYINIGGIVTAIKKARARRAAREKPVVWEKAAPKAEKEYKLATKAL